jgi:Copper type II ascorbate-dependent monooxygenase, C-terminal domain
MRFPRWAVLAFVVLVFAGTITGVTWRSSAAKEVRPPKRAQAVQSGPRITTISLTMATAYKPKAPPGATDDYHCTLMNPHVAHNSYIISSQFFPGSIEDHHAILFLVPAALAAQAERDNVDGKGWTCFGEAPLPNTSLAQISNTPWLSAWAPGHGADDLPKGTGILLPAGSLVIMQVHYNLLLGDNPVKNSLVLHTVPATTPLLPLSLDLMPAPPDIPCPSGVTGPLCNRSASLANLGMRFGQSAVQFVNTLEAICGRNPSDPPEGDTTSCTWPVYTSGYIVRVGAHMHLLGASFKMVLNPGTPEAKTILDVPDYNFHYQRAYNIAPVAVSPGDKVQVSCTYDPRLAQELPALRSVAPHFVTWGDGSSDEMCLGLMWTSASLPNSKYPV